MRRLPRMTAPEIVTVETPAVTSFPDLALVSMVVRPHVGGLGSASMRFVPYDYASDTVFEGPGRDIVVETNNFVQYLADRPALADAVANLTVELTKVAAEAWAEQTQGGAAND